MLVLSRKPGERVLVGEDVEVVVLEVDGDRVKLGFDALRYVPICRAEIHKELADCLAAGEGASLAMARLRSSSKTYPVFLRTGSADSACPFVGPADVSPRRTREIRPIPADFAPGKDCLMKPLQGHLLIAPPQERDLDFIRTVILLIQHSQEQAFGVALNGRAPRRCDRRGVAEAGCAAMTSSSIPAAQSPAR